MSIDQCLSYLTVSKDIPILLKSADNPIVAAIPTIIAAIISFAAAMFVAYMGHKTSKAAINANISQLRLDGISDKLSAVYSLTDQSFDDNKKYIEALEISNSLRITLASEDSIDLSGHIEKLSTLKKSETQEWRKKFLDLSYEYITKLRRKLAV